MGVVIDICVKISWGSNSNHGDWSMIPVSYMLLALFPGQLSPLYPTVVSIRKPPCGARNAKSTTQGPAR
jgi:hypothetical protein